MKKKVLVLMGGNSLERDVSLRSGQAVYQALVELGYEATKLDFITENINEIKRINPDLVFIALHGKDGEDGTVQGYLDLLAIPYTGPGLSASVVCMDKYLTKKVLAFEGLPVPNYIAIKKADYDPASLKVESLTQNLGLPLVIKAASQGSSIGIYIVKKQDEILSTIEKVFELDDTALLEQYIDGPLLEVTIIGNHNPQVLPMIEVTTNNEFYDYDAKYRVGGSEHIIPPRISDELKQIVESISVAAYKAVGCRGFSRLDIMVDSANNPYILEINTVPGMTETSLVPDSARYAGISFNELIELILNLAQEK